MVSPYPQRSSPSSLLSILTEKVREDRIERVKSISLYVRTSPGLLSSAASSTASCPSHTLLLLLLSTFVASTSPPQPLSRFRPTFRTSVQYLPHLQLRPRRCHPRGCLLLPLLLFLNLHIFNSAFPSSNPRHSPIPPLSPSSSFLPSLPLYLFHSSSTISTSLFYSSFPLRTSRPSCRIFSPDPLLTHSTTSSPISSTSSSFPPLVYLCIARLTVSSTPFT